MRGVASLGSRKTGTRCAAKLSASFSPRATCLLLSCAARISPSRIQLRDRRNERDASAVIEDEPATDRRESAERSNESRTPAALRFLALRKSSRGGAARHRCGGSLDWRGTRVFRWALHGTAPFPRGQKRQPHLAALLCLFFNHASGAPKPSCSNSRLF